MILLFLFNYLGDLKSSDFPFQASLIEGDIAQAVPLIIFGAAAFVSAVLSFILPETLKRKLPDTVDEAVHFDK